MKKQYFLALPVLLLFLLPISFRGSVYNGISGALYCDSAGGCLHEIGHKMDDELGYPSRSTSFGNAVMIHLAFALRYGLDDTAEAILTQDGMLTYSEYFEPFRLEWLSDPQGELYARIYQLHSGDVESIPPAFREFYSTDKKYVELYECLMSAKFKICGTALHKEK